MTKTDGNNTTKNNQATNGKTANLQAKDSSNDNKQASAFPSLPLTVNSQYLKDLSFESPLAPGIFSALQKIPEVMIDVDVKTAPCADIGPRTHEVTLSIVITARANQEIVFICEVIYAGLFTLGEIPTEIVQPVLCIECPRILFPFARAIIGEITGNAGLPPLMVNPIDFGALYHKKTS